MKWLALVGLILLGQEPDVDALLKQLSSSSGEEQRKAVETLVELGDKVEARLKELKAGSVGLTQWYCDDIIRRIEGKRKLPTVIPPFKRVSLDLKAQPLKVILDTFKSQTGWPITEGIGDFLDGPVTIQIKDATPLEALDAICRSLGADFELDTDWRPTFDLGDVIPPLPVVVIRGAAGRPRAPQAFIRHYRVVASYLRLTRENRFTDEGKGCQIGIKVQWNPDFKPDEIMYQPISVVDDQGRSLYDPKPYMYFAYKAEVRERDRSSDGQHRDPYCRGWDLRYPEPDAKSIASFKGRVTVRVLADRKYVVFEKPEECIGKIQRRDGDFFRLKEFRRDDGRLKVVVQAHSPTNWSGERYIGFPDIELVTDPGEAILNRTEKFYESRADIDGRPHMMRTFHLEYAQAPPKVTAVRVVVDGIQVVDQFEFELKDLPLPK